MKTAKIFKNGRSQAVRLPKEFQMKGDEVYIKRLGTAIMLLPKKSPWDPFISALGKASDDFMSDREQPAHQTREDDL